MLDIKQTAETELITIRSYREDISCRVIMEWEDDNDITMKLVALHGIDGKYMLHILRSETPTYIGITDIYAVGDEICMDAIEYMITAKDAIDIRSCIANTVWDDRQSMDMVDSILSELISLKS